MAFSLLPQQTVSLPVVMAQLWASPAPMAINFLSEGGELCLSASSPQQIALLSGVMAQVWALPALMAINLLFAGRWDCRAHRFPTNPFVVKGDAALGEAAGADGINSPAGEELRPSSSNPSKPRHCRR